MNTFSQWLMKANARRIFLCFIAALVLVGAWWTWKAVEKYGDEVLTPQAATKEKQTRSGLGIVSFINAELASSVQPPENVFRSLDQMEVGQGQNQVRYGTKSSQTVAPKPVTFSLTYKGMFQRTDGKVMALIEDTKSRHGRFYEGGEEVCGFKVGDIGAKSVAISDSGGRAFRLRIHVPKTFEEGNHGNN